MSITFAPQDRSRVFARVCLIGPGGSGKTYSALRMAFVLAELERIRRGDAVARVVVIDTEKGRANKYVGVNGWHWDGVKPTSYHPRDLVAMIAEADRLGYHAVVVDSGSHYWSGRDGMLDEVDRITKS